MISVEDLENDPINKGFDVEPDKLEEILLESRRKYFVGEEPDFSDKSYDTLVTILNEVKPDNQISKTIGWRSKDTLPFYAGSLNKVFENDIDKFTKWIKKFTGPYVITPKFDGLSGIFYVKNGKQLLFTRGDGLTGTNISHRIPFISGIPYETAFDYAIRGELILSKTSFKNYFKGEKNPRSSVAGMINRKSVDNKLKYIEFVPYELISYKGSDRIKPSAQFELMTELTTNVIKPKLTATISVEKLLRMFNSLTEKLDYVIDGIVITNDKSYERKEENPKHSIAFKPVIFESKISTVKSIEWNVSRWKTIIPTIIIEPVQLDGTEVNRVTGNNAKHMINKKIGVGSKVEVIKSGAIIPKIIKVIKEVDVVLPDIPHKWDETGTHIVANENSNEENIKAITYFYTTIGAKGISAGLIKRLYENDYKTIQSIKNISEIELLQIDGFKDKSARNFIETRDSALNNATLDQIMVGSSCFGKSIGIRKLKLLFDANVKLDKDTTESDLTNVKGIGPSNAKVILEGIIPFNTFYQSLNINAKKVKKTVTSDKVVLFTGFRDKEIEQEYINNGYTIASSLTKKTTLVLYKGDKTAKVNKAIENGIEVKKII